MVKIPKTLAGSYRIKRTLGKVKLLCRYGAELNVHIAGKDFCPALSARRKYLFQSISRRICTYFVAVRLCLCPSLKRAALLCISPCLLSFRKYIGVNIPEPCVFPGNTSPVERLACIYSLIADFHFYHLLLPQAFRIVGFSKPRPSLLPSRAGIRRQEPRTSRLCQR